MPFYVDSLPLSKPLSNGTSTSHLRTTFDLIPERGRQEAKAKGVRAAASNSLSLRVGPGRGRAPFSHFKVKEALEFFSALLRRRRPRPLPLSIHPLNESLPICQVITDLLFKSSARLGVPHVVGHLVAEEPLEVLLLHAVRVLALHRLPPIGVKPGNE